MSDPRRLLVVGSLNMDLIVRVEHLPAAGETVTGGRFFTAPGGKGANQAVAAARMGARVQMVGRVGEDAYGEALLAAARADGVDLARVQRDSFVATGVALITVDADGENSIAVAPGANHAIRVADLPSEMFLGVDSLVLQLELPLEVVARAAQMARERGIPVILNAAPARTDLAEVLPLVEVLVVNETELATLAGVPGDEATQAQALLLGGPTAVVVTLGHRGALVVTLAGMVAVATVPVAVVDTTGAGDAFVGALAARYVGLDSLVEAVRVGCVAGALACTRSGAQPSLPTAAEVMAVTGG